MKRLTKTEPIENEGSLLLDHDYDGIKELIIIYRHGGCIYSMFVLLSYIYFMIRNFGGDNQEMELKKKH
jgi:cytochrome c oxidase cbb3-type subunit 3